MSDFTDAIKHYTSGLSFLSPGLCRSCPECQSIYGMAEDSHRWDVVSDEGWFSWSRCDCCGTSLGGNRYAAHARGGTNGDGKLIHLDICGDCLQYLANGTEPENWEG